MLVRAVNMYEGSLCLPTLLSATLQPVSEQVTLVPLHRHTKWNLRRCPKALSCKQWHSPGPSDQLQWHPVNPCAIRMPPHMSLPQGCSPIRCLDYPLERGRSPVVIYRKSSLPRFLRQRLDHMCPLWSPTAWCPIYCQLPTGGTQEHHVPPSAPQTRESDNFAGCFHTTTFYSEILSSKCI